MRAAVIGAGLAGLWPPTGSCARVEVEVLEARDRVGGRTWSRTLANGAVVELGAEFILPGNTEVERSRASSASASGTRGCATAGASPAAGIGDTESSSPRAWPRSGAALEELDGRPSARELLDALPIAPARARRSSPGSISSASSADDVPASDMAGLAHIGDDPAPSVAGGNQGLALALAGRLQARRRPRRPGRVGAVGRGRRAGADRRGRAIEADRCVIAVPASVTRANQFDPSSRRRKREALAASATATRRSSSSRSPSRRLRAP